METIQVKNLRLLEDTGSIELKSITVLLGSNGSGKSTFLRTFPLMKQSIEKRTSSPILWYAGMQGYVDFGSFRESVYNFDVDRKISFKFSIPWERKPKKQSITFEFEISNTESDVMIDSYFLSFWGHQASLKLDQKGKIVSFIVNKNDFSDEVKDLQNIQPENIVPYFVNQETKMPAGRFIFHSVFDKKIKEKIKSQIRNKPSDSAINKIISVFYANIDSCNETLDFWLIDPILKSWQKKVSSWNINTPFYDEIKNLFVANYCFSILDSLNRYFLNFCQNISYSKPVRATAERDYRYQGLEIREVEPNGENLAMFIKGLQDEADNRLEKFQTWTDKYFGFSVLVQIRAGHISLKIQEKNSTQQINLADTGFGFSQILPIITQLWWLTYRYSKKTALNDDNFPLTFAIEQPELHLHPKLQALLADAFVATINEAKQNKINLKLIIETHSETIINRLGSRIANEDLNHDDVNIVIFEREKNQKSAIVKIAKYDEEGFLDNWPIGFFEPDIIKGN